MGFLHILQFSNLNFTKKNYTLFTWRRLTMIDIFIKLLEALRLVQYENLLRYHCRRATKTFVWVFSEQNDEGNENCKNIRNIITSMM